MVSFMPIISFERHRTSTLTLKYVDERIKLPVLKAALRGNQVVLYVEALANNRRSSSN